MGLRSQPAPSLELGLVILLGLLWGSPYALTKIGLETIPPVTLVAWRLALAAAVLWLVVVWRASAIPGSIRFAGWIFVQGIISCVLPYTLITLGQQTVASGLAAVLNSTIPLMVCVVSLVWTHHEAVTSRRVLAIAVGFAGVLLIVGTETLTNLGQDVVGQAAILLASFSSALSAIYGRRFASVAPEVVAAGMLTAAAIVLLPLSVAVDQPWRISPSVASLLALMVNAVVATGLGFVLYFRLIRTVGTIGTASTSYLKPAVGMLIGWAFLSEPLSWTLIAGMAAILAGVAAINAHQPHPGISSPDPGKRSLEKGPS